MTATQVPFWQRHSPCPQSMVPGRHSIVHATSPQLGAADANVQVVGWQHSAGTQSASLAHA